MMLKSMVYAVGAWKAEDSAAPISDRAESLAGPGAFTGHGESYMVAFAT
jgi:hypothetical protein